MYVDMEEGKKTRSFSVFPASATSYEYLIYMHVKEERNRRSTKQQQQQRISSLKVVHSCVRVCVCRNILCYCYFRLLERSTWANFHRWVFRVFHFYIRGGYLIRFKFNFFSSFFSVLYKTRFYSDVVFFALSFSCLWNKGRNGWVVLCASTSINTKTLFLSISIYLSYHLTEFILLIAFF